MMHSMNLALRPTWRSGADVVAYLCAVVSGSCFIIPIAFFYLMQYRALFSSDVMVEAIQLLWLAAASVGVAGCVAGVVALVKKGFHWCLGIEIVMNSVPAVWLCFVAVIERGIPR